MMETFPANPTSQPTMQLRPLVSPFLALSLLAGAASADVLTVDAAGGPGADYTVLQEAIDAAAEGDILVLRPGTYAPAPVLPFKNRVVGKSLSIIGDGPADSVRVLGLKVRDLVLGQEFLLRKVNLDDSILDLTNNAGSVWIEGVTGVAQNFAGQGHPLLITNCDAVSVNRCTLRGARELLSPYSAVVSVNSNVSIYDSSLEGASGYAIIQTGADAVSVDGGTLFAAGTTFLGGGSGCANDALQITGGAVVTTRDCTFTPGTPGSCVDLLPLGVPVNVVAGYHTELAGASRFFRIGSPATVGGVADLLFEGQPADLVVLNIGTSLGSTYLPPIGTLQIGLPLAGLLTLGSANGNGDLQIPLAMPTIGVEGIVVPLQVTAIAGPELVLTGGSVLVLLAN